MDHALAVEREEALALILLEARKMDAINVFENCAEKLYRQSLNSAREKLIQNGLENPSEWAQHPPDFMEQHKEAWMECCQIWATQVWQEKSRKASENRRSGPDRAHNLGGSINSCEIKRKMMLEAPGQNIGYIEMAQKMKVRKTCVWVDERSQKNVADYNAKMIQKHGENWRETHQDDKDVWLDCCGGNTHRHIYMIGSTVRSSDLKKSRASQSGQSNTPLAPGTRWVTQDEFDAMREQLIKQNEDEKQHDREEIE